jgi:hypothetical protein
MDGVRFVESPTFYPSDSQPAPYSNQITAPHEMMQNFLEFLDRPRLIPAVVCTDNLNAGVAVMKSAQDGA